MTEAALFPESVLAPVAVPEDSISDERYTPESVLEIVRSVGSLALDPYTTPDNRTRAAEFCYRGGPMCGNRADWLAACQAHRGLVWFQPPYSRGKIAPAIDKAVIEARRGAEIVGLVIADLSTAWGAELFRAADALAFWRGRIAFIRGGPEGTFDAGLTRPSLFFYCGDRPGAFRRAFAPYANVVVRGAWE